MSLRVKEFLHETFDIDQSLSKTFLTLFTDPRKVVTRPDVFMKPWRYATYVVSISCLIYWFAIRMLDDPNEHQILWAVPRRLLDLEIGHTNFYETTQPLKRLILGVAGFYIALLVVFFKERKGLMTISLYLTGHSVFTTFIIQTFRIVILRGGTMTNGDALIGVVTHLIYLSYAGIRVFQPKAWVGLVQVPAVFVIYYLLYSSTSTFFVATLYYDVLARHHRLYEIKPESNVQIYHEVIKVPTEDTTEILMRRRLEMNSAANTPDNSFGSIVDIDSILLAVEYVASEGEISKASVASFSSAFERKWTVAIFEKSNRYSPDPRGIHLKVDSAGATAIVCYRIPNDINSTLKMCSINIATGVVNYCKSFDFKVDDFEVQDVALDQSTIYVCGMAQDQFRNNGLGMLARFDLAGGKMQRVSFIGEPSFASWTMFDKMKVRKSEIELTVKHDYKRFIYFRTEEWSTLAIDKALLN